METKRINPNVKRSDDTNALMESCRVFWAFSNEQFSEGKKKIGLLEGEKLVDLGMGGFMPVKYKETFIQGMKDIADTFTEAMKDEEARKAYILYELDNHEAYYTHSIDDTMAALGDDFTREEILACFDGRRKKY